MIYNKDGVPMFKLKEYMIAFIEIKLAEKIGIPREAWAKTSPDKRLTILKWQAALN